MTENVPPKAQKALKDLQDFLPYKSYHLVDMAWLRTSWNASSQITGPKGESYVVDISVADPHPVAQARHLEIRPAEDPAVEVARLGRVRRQHVDPAEFPGLACARRHRRNPSGRAEVTRI